MGKMIGTIPRYIAPGIVGVKNEEDGTCHAYDTWKHKNLNPEDVDDKIYIYERQVKKWFLERATRIKEGEHTGFVVLMIGVSYIEGVQQYIEGERSGTRKNLSGACFVRCLRRIFKLRDVPDSRLRSFCDQVRCGLFHDGMTREQVVIRSNRSRQIIDFSKPDEIWIDHKKFIARIKDDFNQYILDLKNKNKKRLRDNFDDMFHVVKQEEHV
jgi:hypothetical protein